MAGATKDIRPVQLRDAQMAEALQLVRQSDSVEFKLVLPESDRASTIKTLGLDVLKAELRQVVFFETPDLKLSRAGLVLRARRIRKGGDTTLKLRPFTPTSVPEKLRRSASFNIEVDAMPGSFTCSGSLKGKASNSIINEVLDGTRPIRKLFSAEQLALYKEHAPKRLDLRNLVPFGPVHVAKLKFAPPQLDGREFTAELWFYPDGARILELSTKCGPDEAFQILAETRAFLTHQGINLTAPQQNKTRKALEYFSRLHRTRRRAA